LRRWVLLRSLDDLVVEKIEGSAEDDPLDTVFVTLTEGLPYGLFLGGLSGDCNSSAAAVWPRWILLDLAELDSFGGNIVSGVCEIEQGPE